MPRKILAQPFAKNGIPADYLHFQRKYYNESPTIYPGDPTLPRPLDTWYEKPLFGKVDTMRRYAYPNPSSLKPIHKDLKTLNFVADAYSDMVEFVDNAAASLKTCMTSIIKVKKPKKAYESLTSLYYDHFNGLNQSFLVNFLSSKKKNHICNFKRYIDNYTAFVKMNSNFSHTLAGYLASNKTSNRTSGMIIEFSKDPYDMDNLKWRKYLSSDFFPDYVRIAHQFGFFVNKHIPWQIAANLYSKGMKKYMSNYGINNPVQQFNTNFLQAEYISYISFKRYMFASYNSFISNQPNVERIKVYNTINNNIIDSTYQTRRFLRIRPTEFGKPYGNTYEDFTSKYSDHFLLEKYLQLRLIENKIALSRKQHQNLAAALGHKLKKIGLYKTTIFLSDVLTSPKNKSKYGLTSKKRSSTIIATTTTGAPSSPATGGSTTGY